MASSTYETFISQVRDFLVERGEKTPPHVVFSSFINECKAQSIDEPTFYKKVLAPAFKSINWTSVEIKGLQEKVARDAKELELVKAKESETEKRFRELVALERSNFLQAFEVAFSNGLLLSTEIASKFEFDTTGKKESSELLAKVLLELLNFKNYIPVISGKWLTDSYVNIVLSADWYSVEKYKKRNTLSTKLKAKFSALVEFVYELPYKEILIFCGIGIVGLLVIFGLYLVSDYLTLTISPTMALILIILFLLAILLGFINFIRHGRIEFASDRSNPDYHILKEDFKELRRKISQKQSIDISPFQDKIRNIEQRINNLENQPRIVELQVERNQVATTQTNTSAPAAQEFYAPFPDTGNGFTHSKLSSTQNGERAYKIVITGDRATFQVSTNEVAQKFALSDFNTYLSPACVFTNQPKKNCQIVTVEKGNLIKLGSKWVIQSKAKIEFK